MKNKTALLLLACFIFGCTKNKTLSDLVYDAEPMMRAQASNDTKDDLKLAKDEYKEFKEQEELHIEQHDK